ncbi:hypothetical protein F5887DRAFT_235493 [Amanita rubescens]|nr:hypothetical protein F5887DRAFT_235493 [Amanita rubescens]
MMLLTMNAILVFFLSSLATPWAVNATVPYRVYPQVLACSLSRICSIRCLAQQPHEPINSDAHKACSVKCETDHMHMAHLVASKRKDFRVTYTPPDQYESNMYCDVYYEHHQDLCPHGQSLDNCKSYCPGFYLDAAWEHGSECLH